VGTLLARSYFGTERYEKSAYYGITLPFRTDIMPGSVIQLEKSDRKDSYIGTHLFGIVGSTRITCDTMSEQPSLFMEVNLFAVRDNVANADDQMVTFNGNPLYKGPWVGMTLDGELLSTPKNTDHPKALTAGNFNTNTAATPAAPANQTFNPAFPFIPQPM
jgi:hypothetical protein